MNISQGVRGNFGIVVDFIYTHICICIYIYMYIYMYMYVYIYSTHLIAVISLKCSIGRAKYINITNGWIK